MARNGPLWQAGGTPGRTEAFSDGVFAIAITRRSLACPHSIFRRLRYANNSVMRSNLLLLMAVSWLPFPTKLIW